MLDKDRADRSTGWNRVGVMVAAIAAYFLVGFAFGVPAPGMIRRYAYVDLIKAQRVVDQIAEENVNPLECPMGQSGPWDGEFHISHLTSRVVLYGYPDRRDYLDGLLTRANLPPDIVDVREGNHLPQCPPGGPTGF